MIGKMLRWTWLAGLLIRWAYFVHVYSHGGGYPDEIYYWQLGSGLLREGALRLPETGFGGFVVAGEPTAYFGFTAPAVFAGLIALFGENWLALRLMLSLASWSALAFFLNRFLSSRVSSKVALVSVAIAAIHPVLIALSGYFVAEAVFIPFIVLCLWLGERYRLGPSPRRALLLGLAWGLCNLTKMNFFFFQWIHFAILVWGESRPALLRNLGAFALGLALILSPWVIRNQIAFGHPVLETKGGFNLVVYNLPRAGHAWWEEDFTALPTDAWPEASSVIHGWKGPNEAERSFEGLRIYREMVKNHPVEILQNAGARFLRTFPLWPAYWPLPSWAKGVSALFFTLLYTGIFLGLREVLRTHRAPELWAIVFYVIFFASLTNGSLRHRAGAEPLLIALSSIGWLRQRSVV